MQILFPNSKSRQVKYLDAFVKYGLVDLSSICDQLVLNHDSLLKQIGITDVGDQDRDVRARAREIMRLDPSITYGQAIAAVMQQASVERGAPNGGTS